MKNYNYYEAVKADIREYLKETDCRKYSELEDEMWTSDRITGNGSGSYTFNSWEAEENICHNLDLFAAACEEFGNDFTELRDRGAEIVDVIIRLYVLPECLAEVLDELKTKKAR